MTRTHSALSVYGIIDRMDDAAIQAWLKFHQRLKYPPRFINMFTAATFNDAPNLLRLVRDRLPDTIPVWRGYDGKDAWGNTPDTKLKWDDSNFYLRLWEQGANTAQAAAGLWFARRVKPFVGVIRETGAIVHLLNEADPLFNSTFETECIRLLGEEGIRAGAFAWAAGTPDWLDYLEWGIADEVTMAAKYDSLVMTHEYSGLLDEEQNSLINRNQYLVTKYDQQKLKKPDVFIGEFGLARAAINPFTGKIDLDPDAGWRDMGVNEIQYGDFIKGSAKTWYVPTKVSFSLYSWPDWGNNGSFGVSKHQALLDSLVTASEWMSFSVEEKVMTTPTPAPVEIMTRPAEAISGIRMRVKTIPSPFRNLRESWDFEAKDTGDLFPNDVIRRFDIPVHTGRVSALSTGKWVYVEKLDSDSPTAKVTAAGYVWSDRITYEPLATSTGEVPVVVPPAPPPTPPPVELPPPPQETLPEPAPAPELPPAPIPTMTAKRYSLVIEATEAQHSKLEQSLMAVIMGLAAFGTQLALGSKVSLVTEAMP